APPRMTVGNIPNVPLVPVNAHGGRSRTSGQQGIQRQELCMTITELTGLDVPTGLLIGGEWAAGKATFPVVDPATEEPLAEVADGTVSDALDAVSAAYDALPGWAATPPRQRAEVLRKAFELMTERAEQFARLMSAENGKSLRDARGEAAYAAEFFRWYAEGAVRVA